MLMTELAKKMDVSVTWIHYIKKHGVRTINTAKKLERATGIDAKKWIFEHGAWEEFKNI